MHWARLNWEKSCTMTHTYTYNFHATTIIFCIKYLLQVNGTSFIRIWYCDSNFATQLWLATMVVLPEKDEAFVIFAHPLVDCVCVCAFVYSFPWSSNILLLWVCLRSLVPFCIFDACALHDGYNWQDTCKSCIIYWRVYNTTFSNGIWNVSINTISF